MFPYESRAVTTKLNADPAVVLRGMLLRMSALADEGVMLTGSEVAESEPSLAVKVRLPDVFNLELNEPDPPWIGVVAGRSPAESLEAKLRLPLYPVAVFPFASFAVTVKFNAVPAGADAGSPVIVRCVASPELTSTCVASVTETPEMLAPIAVIPA
jgi:hypothetical protein